MLIAPTSRNEFDRLATKLAGATKASAILFAEIFAASPRLMTLRAMGKTERLDRLLACEAWTEAAIELVALEAPEWRIQRLCLDDREWICALTRFPDLPEWLDESAEGRHPLITLAILDALLVARARAAVTYPSTPWQLPGVAADCADYR
mgnify:FL=1